MLPMSRSGWCPLLYSRPPPRQIMAPSGKLGDPSLQLLDKNARVLGVIDGDGDQVDAGILESGLEGGHEILRAFHPVTGGAIGLRIAYEIGVAEGKPPVRKLIDRLLPAYHSI